MSAGRGEIVGIQYLRGVAALMVVCDHAAVTLSNPKYFGAHLWNSLLVRGASGVDLFFLVSGFIITWVSLDAQALPRMTRLSFFGRRFVRIVPLMWLGVISFAVLRLLGRGELDIWATVRALALWPVGELEPLNIWTLRFEAIFYGVFALSMMGPKVLRPLLWIWAAAPVVLALAGGTSNEWLRNIAYPVNVEFGAGVLVGLATIHWKRRPFRLPIHPLIVAGACGVALMVLAAVFDLRFHLVDRTLLAAVFCAPILLFGVHVVCPAGPLDWLGRLIGDASYALYLFHPHILLVLATVWSKAAPHTPIWILVPGEILIAVACGVAIHLWLERPLLRLLGHGPANTPVPAKTPTAAE